MVEEPLVGVKERAGVLSVNSERGGRTQQRLSSHAKLCGSASHAAGALLCLIGALVVP